MQGRVPPLACCELGLQVEPIGGPRRHAGAPKAASTHARQRQQQNNGSRGQDQHAQASAEMSQRRLGERAVERIGFAGGPVVARMNLDVLFGRKRYMRVLSAAIAFTVIWGLAPTASEAASNTSCFPYPASSADNGGAGVLEVLKDVSINTKWAELPVETKIRLQTLADDRLAMYRSHWGADALTTKQTILLRSPTAKMTSAINQYYQTTYQTFLPSTFALAGIKNAALVDALVRNYLGVVAAARATLTYPDGTLPNCDWDGESHFDSIRLPDRQTYEDIKAYNRSVVEDLTKIDDLSLDELERKLKQYVLFSARSNAEGSRGDNYGSDYLEQACDIAELNYDILSGYEGDHGRPKIFASDEEVLRETNALYLHNTQLKWFDVGTRASAFSYCATTQDRIRKDVGDPTMNNVAKGMILLQNWWFERTTSIAAQKCSIYSAEDRMRIWDAFSADQQFNNDGSLSMETYQNLLDKYKTDKTIHYGGAAQSALKHVFPNEAVLPLEQYMKVVTALNKRTDFGVFAKRILEELDVAQGTINGPAARLWASALAANVEYIGGNYVAGQSVRSNESDEIKQMFDEVKPWVARNYQGYPINITSLFEHISIEVDTRNNASTENGTAKIWIGVGTKRSKAEYYSWLLHELRHAVMYAWHTTAPDKSQVKNDEGPALEGSGVAVEDLLLLSFLKETLNSDAALALYVLDYGIRDARFAGTTDATLKRYLRSGCAGESDVDTIEFTKNIARSYGLLEERADTVAQRAHAGTQYLQYIWGGLYMLGELAYLQTQVDPSERRRVDPFVLFVCGLNTPRRDKPYIDALRMCMKI